MGNCWSSYLPMPPCANCGKAASGNMNSSEWGHHYGCCSDACGRRLAHKLEHGMGEPQMPSDSPYSFAAAFWGQGRTCDDRIYELRLRIKQLEHRLKHA